MSNYYPIAQRKNHSQEIISYFHDETKYDLFYSDDYAKVIILKNDIIIYNKENDKKAFENTIELEKNQNYTIIFDSNSRDPLIIIQLFNEEKTFKYNFENGPYFLKQKKYYFEIDISKYQLDDIILFEVYASNNYIFKYQYKSNIKGNNFIDIGSHKYHNYIPIKKRNKDSSIYVYIEFNFQKYFPIFNLVQNINIEEITEEFNNIIQGPIYFFLDYFEFNDINSIGFRADENFFYYE